MHMNISLYYVMIYVNNALHVIVTSIDDGIYKKQMDYN